MFKIAIRGLIKLIFIKFPKNDEKMKILRFYRDLNETVNDFSVISHFKICSECNEISIKSIFVKTPICKVLQIQFKY